MYHYYQAGMAGGTGDGTAATQHTEAPMVRPFAGFPPALGWGGMPGMLDAMSWGQFAAQQQQMNPFAGVLRGSMSNFTCTPPFKRGSCRRCGSLIHCNQSSFSPAASFAGLPGLPVDTFGSNP